MDRLFTISIVSENHPGVLHRITTAFTRRKINVESLCVSETEVKGLSRFTISLKLTESAVKKVVSQLNRIVEVKSVKYFGDGELYIREVALYRIAYDDSAKRDDVIKMAYENNATVVAVDNQYVVISRTSHESDIETLYYLLKPYGVVEFIRSGRIAIEMHPDVIQSEIESVNLSADGEFTVRR